MLRGERTKLYNKNSAAIFWVNKPHRWRQAKHNDVKFNFMRDCAQDGAVDLVHINRKSNISNYIS